MLFAFFHNKNFCTTKITEILYTNFEKITTIIIQKNVFFLLTKKFLYIANNLNKKSKITIFAMVL